MKSIHGQGRAGAKALRSKPAWCAGVIKSLGLLCYLREALFPNPQHASFRIVPRLPLNVNVTRRMCPSRAGVSGRGGVSSALCGSALGAEASSLLWLTARPRLRRPPPPGG